MSSVTTIRTILERLGFSSARVTYLTGAYVDVIDDVDTTIKGVTNPGGTVTTGTGPSEITSRNNGIPVSIRAVANLKLCVYYLKHM
jgi:FlaG/FlaF family flagellin (archaellin)